MGVVLSAYNTSMAFPTIFKAYDEAGIINPASLIESSRNDTQIVFAKMATVDATNRGSAFTELPDTTNTETSAIMSPDLELSAHRYIGRQELLTNTQDVVDGYVAQCGQGIAAGKDRRIWARLVKNAGDIVSFDRSLTDADATLIQNMILEVTTNWDEAFVPMNDRYMLLAPYWFNKIPKVIGMVSTDYRGDFAASRAFSEINYLGVNIRSYVGLANQNISTGYDAAYQGNYTAFGTPALRVEGVAYTKGCVGINYYSPLSVDVNTVPDKGGLTIVQGHMVMGTAAVRTENIQLIGSVA